MQLEAAAEFSAGFLDVVKRACRKYKTLNERTHQQEDKREKIDSNDSLFVPETSSLLVYRTLQTARRSQQQGPRDRLYARLSAAPTEISRVKPQASDLMVGSVGTSERTKTSAMKPTLGRNIAVCNGKAPPTEPKAMRYENQVRAFNYPSKASRKPDLFQTAQVSRVSSPAQAQSAALPPSAQSKP